jgi:hypothetical protein
MCQYPHISRAEQPPEVCRANWCDHRRTHAPADAALRCQLATQDRDRVLGDALEELARPTEGDNDVGRAEDAKSASRTPQGENDA